MKRKKNVYVCLRCSSDVRLFGPLDGGNSKQFTLVCWNPKHSIEQFFNYVLSWFLCSFMMEKKDYAWWVKLTYWTVHIWMLLTNSQIMPCNYGNAYLHIKIFVLLDVESNFMSTHFAIEFLESCHYILFRTTNNNNHNIGAKKNGKNGKWRWRHGKKNTTRWMRKVKKKNDNKYTCNHKMNDFRPRQNKIKKRVKRNPRKRKRYFLQRCANHPIHFGCDFTRWRSVQCVKLMKMQIQI